jgi:hypothetical protein
MLFREGYRQFDLTPGGDAYKDRFANGQDLAHTLTVLPSAPRRHKAYAYRLAVDASRTLLKRFDVTPIQVRHHVANLRHRPGPVAAGLLRRARAWVACRRETRVYFREIAAPGSETSPGAADVRRNALEDLLAYQPTGTGPSRQAFLSAALARLEEGEHIYTCTEQGRLLHACCMAEDPSPKSVEAIMPGLSLPAKSVLVHDLYVSCDVRPATALLRRILQDAAGVAGAIKVFVLLPAAGKRVQSVVDQMGLTHAASIVAVTHFGRTNWLTKDIEAPAGLLGVAAALTPIPMIAKSLQLTKRL